MDNLVKTQINRMSKITDTRLTERHMSVLEYAHAFYKKNKVGPLYQNIFKYTGSDKEAVERLFPHGLTSIYIWVGIPVQTTDKLCKPMAEVHVEDYREIYFDHNATTYIRDEVKKSLVAYYGGTHGFGNPSSSTTPGKNAYDLVRKARNQIAKNIKISVACGRDFYTRLVSLFHLVPHVVPEVKRSPIPSKLWEWIPKNMVSSGSVSDSTIPKKMLSIYLTRRAEISGACPRVG